MANCVRLCPHRVPGIRWRQTIAAGIPVRHPPQSGWLNEWGRLKGGHLPSLGVALKRAFVNASELSVVPSAASCSRMYLSELLPFKADHGSAAAFHSWPRSRAIPFQFIESSFSDSRAFVSIRGPMVSFDLWRISARRVQSRWATNGHECTRIRKRVLIKPIEEDFIEERSNLFESHCSNQWLTQNRVNASGVFGDEVRTQANWMISLWSPNHVINVG